MFLSQSQKEQAEETPRNVGSAKLAKTLDINSNQSEQLCC